MIVEAGVDRALYSVDYPFEDMIEAKEWFDRAVIGEADRGRIGRVTAQRLFRICVHVTILVFWLPAARVARYLRSVRNTQAFASDVLSRSARMHQFAQSTMSSW